MQAVMAEQAPPVPQRPNCTPMFASSPCGQDWENYRSQLAAYNQWVNEHNHQLVQDLQSRIANGNDELQHLQTHVVQLQQQLQASENAAAQARKDGEQGFMTALGVGLLFGLILGIVAHSFATRFRIPKTRAANA